MSTDDYGRYYWCVKPFQSHPLCTYAQAEAGGPMHIINHRAVGVHAGRVNEVVTVIGRKPNGLATLVMARGKQEWLPSRWLTEMSETELATAREREKAS